MLLTLFLCLTSSWIIPALVILRQTIPPRERDRMVASVRMINRFTDPCVTRISFYMVINALDFKIATIVIGDNHSKYWLFPLSKLASQDFTPL